MNTGILFMWESKKHVEGWLMRYHIYREIVGNK